MQRAARILGLLLLALPLRAQDATSLSPRSRFSGTVASLQTTHPVPVADIRLIFVDSVKAQHTTAATPSGDVYVDSARSRVGVTDDSGHFNFRGMSPGHYLLQVRRLGFEPFEGLVTIASADVELELALNQVVPILPRVVISADAVDRVTQRLDRVGFVSRSRSGTSAQFVTRADVLKSHDIYLAQLLERYGITSDVAVEIDRIPSDWETLRDFPIDLVIGVEIYRQRGTLPVEFDRTRIEPTALGGGNPAQNGQSGAIARATVLVWTFIP